MQQVQPDTGHRRGRVEFWRNHQQTVLPLFKEWVPVNVLPTPQWACFPGESSHATAAEKDPETCSSVSLHEL